ncbi:hypothetical protein [Neobacillus mesonae]|uniref:hypothetical protein n=1 Tax=Neobacillus mesonae TaxID=1193713 RepID=UPI0020418BE3|nr:hypothetical protein [Neobacillus mesonae]MCM3571493.1 hypothetical protein [Neobacillus mesonae]
MKAGVGMPPFFGGYGYPMMGFGYSPFGYGGYGGYGGFHHHYPYYGGYGYHHPWHHHGYW